VPHRKLDMSMLMCPLNNRSALRARWLSGRVHGTESPNQTVAEDQPEGF
jgi:hypothetical protein